jgi:hypothetical protein
MTWCLIKHRIRLHGMVIRNAQGQLYLDMSDRATSAMYFIFSYVDTTNMVVTRTEEVGTKILTLLKDPENVYGYRSLRQNILVFTNLVS